MLALQIVTGIFLTMSYKPSATEAFGSVEYIMRDVEWGWLIRYMHSTGASAFFIVVYLHMFRALLYGSHRKPRELLWIFGVLIYLALMAEAFFGYLLPWGNMSYWGAQVIVSLFGTFPLIGDALIEWIRGDYFISDITLNRFFALHVVALPLVLIFLVVAHVLALHEVGSNNPDGIEIKKTKGPDGHPVDGIPFHPYYTVKDLFGLSVFLVLFAAVVFFAPEMGGLFLEAPNFEPANPLLTPEHIAPVWYFTPYYAILRAVPAFAGTQVLGRARAVRRRAAAVLRALAGQVAGQVDPLPRADLQDRADGIRRGLHHARLLRPQAGSRAVHDALGDRHDHLLRVLPADALVFPHRPHEAGARAGDVLRALRALVLAAAALPAVAGAAGDGYPLQAANTDVSNLASLQRGARNFVNYCLGCHSAKYMRYSQLAADLALTEDELRTNLMFTGNRVYDTMDTAMPAEKARQWFGNAPPDLSLIVRSRGTDYVYTFLRAFYADPSRPTGVNNAVLPGTAMPHVLAGLQGLQRPRYEQVTGEGRPRNRAPGRLRGWGAGRVA